MENKKHLPFSKKLVFVLFIVVFTLLFFEISFRIFYVARDIYQGRRMARISASKEIGYELKPNFQTEKFRINSYGFRGKEFELNKDKDIIRIIALGDSITFGPSLNEEDTYLSLLERKLNNGALNGHFEVINASIGGYSIWQYLALYKEKVKRLSADMIIVAMCQNDFIKSGPYHKDIFGIVRGDFLLNGKDSFFDHSILYKMISRRLKQFTQRDQDPKSRIASLTMDANWEEGIIPLKQLVEAIKHDGVDYFFLIFPMKHQIQGKDQNSSERFADFIKENNIPTLDLLHKFKYLDKEIYEKNDILHFNRVGNKLIADAVYEFIIDYFT